VNTWEAFVRQVFDYPYDALSWLAFADYLDDQGHWLGPFLRSAVGHAPDYEGHYRVAQGELPDWQFDRHRNRATDGKTHLLLLNLFLFRTDTSEPSPSAEVAALVLMADRIYRAGPGFADMRNWVIR